MPDVPPSERAPARLAPQLAPRFALWLALATLVYVALRALLVVSAFDQVALWMYETFPIGTIAEVQLRGLDYPLRFFYDNAAGQILSGLMTVPSFLAFGSSYLALKVVPFLLGLATFFLLFAFLRRYFGLRAALFGAWLFALAPTTVVKYSVIASGNHFENLFFTLLAVAAFYRLHEESESRKRRFAAAYCAGLALFVFLGALIPVGLLLGMHLGLRGLRRSARDLAVGVPGFALGILPLVWLNATTGGRGLGFLSAKFGDESTREGQPVLERAFEFLTSHLPAAGGYEPLFGVSGAALGLVFLSCFLVAYALSLPETLRGLSALATGLVRKTATPAEARAAFERAKLVPFVLYLPLAALAYGLSNFRIGGHAWPIEVAGYRYFLPHFLFAAVLIAVVAARMWTRGGLVRGAGAALAFVPLAIGLSTWTLVDWRFERANLGLCYDGYDLSKLGRGLLSEKNALSQAERVERIASFPRLVRHGALRSIGFNLGALYVEREARAERRAAVQDDTGVVPVLWQIEPERIVAGYPQEWHAQILRGVGTGLRFDVSMDGRRAFYVLPALVRSGCGGRDELEPDRNLGPACDALAEGAALANPALPLESQTQGVLFGNQELVETCLRAADPAQPSRRELAASFARGHGMLCGHLLARGIERDREYVATAASMLPAEARPSFFYGVGLGCAESSELPRLPESLGEIASEAERQWTWMGIGAGLRRIDGEGAPEDGGGTGRALVQMLASALDGAERAHLERGFAGDAPDPP